MPDSTASQYDEHLKNWIKKIKTYADEIPVTEQLLEDVIRRDNIVNIAAKVEVYQLMLEGITNKLNSLLEHMRLFRRNLYEEDQLIEDDAITNLIISEMKLLEENKTRIMKEYQATKLQCNTFLAEMLKSGH